VIVNRVAEWRALKGARIEAPSGVGSGEGCPLPSRLKGLGERCELPHRGLGRNAFWTYFWLRTRLPKLTLFGTMQCVAFQLSAGRMQWV